MKDMYSLSNISIYGFKASYIIRLNLECYYIVTIVKSGFKTDRSGYLYLDFELMNELFFYILLDLYLSFTPKFLNLPFKSLYRLDCLTSSEATISSSESELKT